MKTNLLIFLLLLCLRNALAEDFPTLPVFENDVKQIHLAENQIESFVYYRSSDTSSNRLSLTFFPQNMTTDPGNLMVFFSKFEDMTNLTKRPQHCFIAKISSCVYTIPPEENHIYFLLQCAIGDCKYKFRLSHFSEIHLNHNQREHFIFDDEVQLFNFSIPERTDYSRLLFLVQYRYIPNENDLIFGSQAIDVQINNGAPLIQKLGDMQILIFNSTDPKLCSNCNVTATVTSHKGAIVELEVLLYEVNTLTLELNKFYVDYLVHTVDNNYVLSLDQELVQKDDFIILISINSLSGTQKTLYVNVDSKADPPSASQWKSATLKSYYEEENIQISKADLVYYQLKGIFYYLTVVGDTQGLYSLHISAQENKILPLQLGVKQSGLIRNNELIYYKLQIWKNDEVLQGLTLSSTIMSGHIRVYGRKCGEYDQCKPITLEDIQNKNDISIETSDETISAYKFYPQCPYIFCYYIFAVLGNSSSTNSSKYDIVLQKENMFTNLIENKCSETQINSMEIAKFKLSVEKTKDEIERVTFFINTELDYMVGRNLMCESETSPECKNKIGNLYNPAVFDKTNFELDLAGDYYIYVFGMKSAEFIIFPEVQRQGKSQVFIKLLEGKTMKYFVTFVRQVAYFEFVIDVQENTKIEINIQSNELNALKIYLSRDGGVPGSDNYYLSSSNNYLAFEHDSYSQVVYRLAVEGKVFDSESRKDSSVDFSLMYSSDRTIKHLESNQPYYDTVVSNGVKKFIFFLDTGNEMVYLTKNIIQPEEYTLNMIVSLDRDDNVNKYPDLGVATGSSIKLSNQKIKYYCSLIYSNLYGRCPIYVTIKNDNYEDVYYILNVRTKEFAIQLKQGKEQTTRINEEEDGLSLYFIPSSRDTPVDIYFYSLKFRFDVFASIYNNENSNSFTSWIFPNKNNSDFNFINKHRVSTVIKSSEFDKCWPKCVILFSIKPERKIKTVELIDDLFHMIVSNGFTEANDNKVNQFNSEKGNIKFFKYSLKNLAYKNVSILIDLTNLAGFSEIFVSLNDDSLDEVYPTKDEFDYFSADGHLTISMDSLLMKKNRNSSLLSDLYIGVQCINTVCESSLNVRMTYHMIQMVSHGRPYDFATSPTYDALIFEYFHYDDQNFEFKINKEKGQGKMQMVPCFEFKVEDCLLNHTKEIDLQSFSSSKIRITKSDIEHYCFNCLYLVAVLPNNSILSGTFNVVLDKEFLLLPEGRKFYDDLDDDDQNLYSCKEELEVIVNVYHNEPELYVSRTKGYQRKKYEYQAIKSNDPLITLTIEPDLDNPDSQIHDEIFIIVYARSASNYSITCKSKSSYAILHPGLIEFTEIKSEQIHTYLFNSHDTNNAQHLPKISIGYLSEKSFSLLVSLKFRPTRSDEWGNLNDSSYQVFPLTENNTIFSYNSETFVLSNQSGIYEIQVDNKNSDPVKYSISLQTGEINVMPYDTLMDIHILPNEWMYYETYIPRRGFFVLDLVECIGSMNAFTALDHDRLINHEFEDEFKIFQSQSNLKVIKLNQGTLFLAIRLVGNSSKNVFEEENAFGQLSSHFYEAYDEIPQYKLAIPEEGVLEYLLNFESNKAFVNFKSIYCNYDCDAQFMSTIKVNYTLVVAENNLMLGSHGKCGLLSYQKHLYNMSEFQLDKIYNQDINSIPLQMVMQFNLNEQAESYHVSVIAKIQGYPHSFTPISLYYKDLEIRKPEVKTQRIIAYGISIVLGVLVVILAFCGCYYYGGYKKLVNKLKYEVKDVDNVVAVTSLNQSIEMKSTRYEGLMMDEKL